MQGWAASADPNKNPGYAGVLYSILFSVQAMHSLAAADRPRLSETEAEPQWFMFETSRNAFGGTRGESATSQN